MPSLRRRASEESGVDHEISFEETESESSVAMHTREPRPDE